MIENTPILSLFMEVKLNFFTRFAHFWNLDQSGTTGALGVTMLHYWSMCPIVWGPYIHVKFDSKYLFQPCHRICYTKSQPKAQHISMVHS